MHPLLKSGIVILATLTALCLAVWLTTLEPRAAYEDPAALPQLDTLLSGDPAEAGYEVSADHLLQVAETMVAEARAAGEDQTAAETAAEPAAEPVALAAVNSTASVLLAEAPEGIGCASFADSLGREYTPLYDAAVLTAAAAEEAPEDDGFRPYTTFTDPSNGLTVSIPMSEYYQHIAWACCQKYGVRFELAMGLFGAETSWNAEIGRVGSYIGIGMLSVYYNASRYAAMGIDIYTPEGAIEASIHLLSEKIARYGSESKGLVAYNCGDSGAWNGYFRYGYTASWYSRRVMAIAGAIS